MKLLYFFNKEGKLTPGLLTEKGVFNIDAFQEFNGQQKYANKNWSIADLSTLKDSIHQQDIPGRFYLEEPSLQYGPCVPNPQKIICIGLNYRQHALESGMAIPELPVVFTKYNNTLINYAQDVSLGIAGEQFDYEVELGVVIGKTCKNINKKEALNYVLGYCVANDLSCRDLQFRTSQWLMGKSLDGFLPLSKYVITTDEVTDPQQLQLTCTLNGELRQNSNTNDMIFSVSEIIADLTKHMTLMPGDLILTGTPAGVIMGLPEKNWLKPGDVVKVEIEKIGFTTNKMVI